MTDIPIDPESFPLPSHPIEFGICALNCLDQYRQEVKTDGGDNPTEESTTPNNPSGETDISSSEQSRENPESPEGPITEPGTSPTPEESEGDSRIITPERRSLLICIGSCWTAAQ